MKSLLILFFAALLTSFDLEGQSIDQSKMDKDLEVSKNVLSSLMENSTNNRFLWRSGDKLEAKYQKGYGVIYSIKNNFPMVVYGRARNDNAYVVKGSNIAKVAGVKDEKIIDEDEDGNEKLKAIAKDFMMNYYNLIRQLQPSDKIMIKTAANRENRDLFVVFSTGGQNRSKGKFSIEASVSDLMSYGSGKITEEQMMSKFIEKVISNWSESEPDIEVFSAAFGRLYQSDLADSYYMTDYPWHERMDGFGLTYYLKFYSSTQSNDFFNLPTLKKSNLDLKERNAVVEKAYPEFKEDLKENMLDYGHLLKNLKNDEFLIFNAQLTQCIDCNMPKAIELKVKKSVIDQYRSGVLSLKAAKNKIEEVIIEP
jgi:hypothetical protein